MANIILLARKLSVILLATLGFITLLTGMLLETMPRGPSSSHATALGASKDFWITLHVYAGFAAAGAAIVHVYTNYRGLLYHLGLLGVRRVKPVSK